MPAPIRLSRASEFNFQSDPEAARVVLQKFPMVELVTLDCALSHGLAWEEVDGLMAKQTPKARFLAGEQHLHVTSLPPPDAPRSHRFHPTGSSSTEA